MDKHFTKTKSDWEKEFDLLWGIAPPEILKERQGVVVKEFIRSQIDKAREEGKALSKNVDWFGENGAYNMGFKEGEKAKDDLKVILEGSFDEGKQEAYEKVLWEIEGMYAIGQISEEEGSEFSTPRHYRRSGYNAALDDIKTLISKKLEK